MAELKARRMLGEPGEEEPDPDTLEAREALAARLVAYAPFQRAAAWLVEQARNHTGPRYRRVPLEGAAPPPPPEEDPRRAAGGDGADAHRAARAVALATSPTVASACPPRSPACRRRSAGPAR